MRLIAKLVLACDAFEIVRLVISYCAFGRIPAANTTFGIDWLPDPVSWENAVELFMKVGQGGTIFAIFLGAIYSMRRVSLFSSSGFLGIAVASWSLRCFLLELRVPWPIGLLPYLMLAMELVLIPVALLKKDIKAA